MLGDALTPAPRMLHWELRASFLHHSNAQGTAKPAENLPVRYEEIRDSIRTPKWNALTKVISVPHSLRYLFRQEVPGHISSTSCKHHCHLKSGMVYGTTRGTAG